MVNFGEFSGRDIGHLSGSLSCVRLIYSDAVKPIARAIIRYGMCFAFHYVFRVRMFIQIAHCISRRNRQSRQ